VFIATFADGYKRPICAPNPDRASAFAQELEDWFIGGGYPRRILLNVEPAKRRA